MYLKHFGLREFPFSITPDTAFAFGSRSHQRALNVLLVAQRHGEGFIKVVGEVGTGKTLLCRRFLSCLPAGTVTAYVPNPSMKPRGLLLTLAHELRLPCKLGAGRADHHVQTHGQALLPAQLAIERLQGQAGHLAAILHQLHLVSLRPGRRRTS